MERSQLGAEAGIENLKQSQNAIKAHPRAA